MTAFIHVFATKIAFGGEGVVGGAVQGQVFEAVGAALREGLSMVQLEVVRLSTPLASGVHIGAA
ncbi:MAG TPA: hypothetical protein VEQ58_14280, partial [Polyangiaceae bacterium]|nr:hypothetical protein [Polyangiaceae bacterium]